MLLHKPRFLAHHRRDDLFLVARPAPTWRLRIGQALGITRLRFGGRTHPASAQFLTKDFGFIDQRGYIVFEPFNFADAVNERKEYGETAG